MEEIIIKVKAKHAQQASRFRDGGGCILATAIKDALNVRDVSECVVLTYIYPLNDRVGPKRYSHRPYYKLHYWVDKAIAYFASPETVIRTLKLTSLV